VEAVAGSRQERPQRKVIASSALPMPRPRNARLWSGQVGSDAACWLVEQGGSPPFPAMLPAARLAAPAWPPTAPLRISLEPKAPLAECEDEMPCWSTGEPRRVRPGAVNAPTGVAARATRRMLAINLISEQRSCPAAPRDDSFNSYTLGGGFCLASSRTTNHKTKLHPPNAGWWVVFGFVLLGKEAAGQSARVQARVSPAYESRLCPTTHSPPLLSECPLQPPRPGGLYDVPALARHCSTMPVPGP
jgi:hypothetical protein